MLQDLLSPQAVQFAITGAVIMAVMLVQIPFVFWLEKLDRKKKKKTLDG